MDKDFQDRIDDYLLGRMSAEDRAIFEEEISQDPSKREQLEFTKGVKTAVSSRQSKLKRLQQFKIQYEQEQQRLATRSRRVKRLILWTSSIAAILVLALFILPSTVMYNSTPSMPNSRSGGNVFEPQTPVLSTPPTTGTGSGNYNSKDSLEKECRSPKDSLDRDSLSQKVVPPQNR